MAFTYSVSTDRGKVRLKCGDTTDTGHFLEDDEIDYCLTEANSNINLAAAYACELIAAELSQDCDKEIGDLSIKSSQKAATYLELAKTFRKRAVLTVSPYCGGISVSDKDSIDTDSDRVMPVFKRELHNYDETTDYNEDGD